jgi:hypothetical protein
MALLHAVELHQWEISVGGFFPASTKVSRSSAHGPSSIIFGALGGSSMHGQNNGSSLKSKRKTVDKAKRCFDDSIHSTIVASWKRFNHLHLKQFVAKRHL